MKNHSNYLNIVCTNNGIHTDISESEASDDSFSGDEHEVVEEYTNAQGRRSAAYSIKRKAESVLLKDSTGRSVDMQKYMGSMPAFSQTTSTTDHALNVMKEWETSEKVKYAVAHTGVNDVTNGSSSHIIIKNLKKLLNMMYEKFPEAVIAFSEILYIGRGNRNSRENLIVKAINEAMYKFCVENNFIYVSHDSLQKSDCTLYAEHGRDPKHIDGRGGTAVFVSDILNATGYRRQQRRAVARPGGTTGSVMHITARRPDKRPGSSDMRGNNDLVNCDNDQLFKLVMLRMLQSAR